MVEAMTDVARMEDDGGCLTQGVGLRIGIPPTPQPAAADAGSKLDPEGGPPDSAAPVAAETPDDGKLTWAKYSAWRKTKCPVRGEDDRLSEINQATLELAGELAEVTSSIVSEGWLGLRTQRVEIIDEIGDAIFCAAWAISAWGHEGELVKLDLQLDEYFGPMPKAIAALAVTLQNAPVEVFDFQGINHDLSDIVAGSLIQSQTGVGLTANALKKILYQKRKQDSALQFDRIMYAIGDLRQLLTLAGSNIEAAMRQNMQKLDARFPNGWVPGGGNR